MNRNLFFFVVFLVVAASCGKHLDKTKGFTQGSLLGKWEYTEHYFSIGGPGKWESVQPAGQTVEFKSDGTFTSTASFSGFTQYQIIDSATVKFTPASIASGHVLMRYEVNDAEGSLLLMQREPMCIEGCGYKFRRMH